MRKKEEVTKLVSMLEWCESGSFIFVFYKRAVKTKKTNTFINYLKKCKATPMSLLGH
jgi:hypothetical protein